MCFKIDDAIVYIPISILLFPICLIRFADRLLLLIYSEDQSLNNFNVQINEFHRPTCDTNIYYTTRTRNIVKYFQKQGPQFILEREL